MLETKSSTPSSNDKAPVHLSNADRGDARRTTTRPSSTTNSTSRPGRNPNRSRIASGMVTWPLLVILDTDSSFGNTTIVIPYDANRKYCRGSRPQLRVPTRPPDPGPHRAFQPPCPQNAHTRVTTQKISPPPPHIGVSSVLTRDSIIAPAGNWRMVWTKRRSITRSSNYPNRPPVALMYGANDAHTPSSNIGQTQLSLRRSEE